MNKTKTILSAGLITSSALFSTAAATISMIPGSDVTAEKNNVPEYYRPETDDPTVQFPLVVVDTHEAFKTWCAISSGNDEEFAVVAPTSDMLVPDFFNYITKLTNDFEVDSERVYLVVSEADSPLIQESESVGIFATQIIVDYASPIDAETVVNLLTAIRQ